MTLIGLTFLTHMRPLGIRADQHVNLLEARNALREFRVVVQGPAVFFVGPRGWKHGLKPEQWDRAAPHVVLEWPRSAFVLHWGMESEAELAGVQKYAPPMSEADLEAATAPKGGKR